MLLARKLTHLNEDRVTAPQLASALLASCSLRDHFPPSFPDDLAAVEASVNETARNGSPDAPR